MLWLSVQEPDTVCWNWVEEPGLGFQQPDFTLNCKPDNILHTNLAGSPKFTYPWYLAKLHPKPKENRIVALLDAGKNDHAMMPAFTIPWQLKPRSQDHGCWVRNCKLRISLSHWPSLLTLFLHIQVRFYHVAMFITSSQPSSLPYLQLPLTGCCCFPAPNNSCQMWKAESYSQAYIYMCASFHVIVDTKHCKVWYHNHQQSLISFFKTNPSQDYWSPCSLQPKSSKCSLVSGRSMKIHQIASTMDLKLCV